jgi:hypothetical protein
MQITRVPTDKRARIERKLGDNSREHLGNEEVLTVFRGQTRVSPLVLPLIGPLLVGLVKPRAVLVTGRTVLTVEQSRWSQSTVGSVVSRYDRGSVPIEVTRWGLRIGDDEKIFALPSTLADMHDVARLAERTVA